MLNHKKTLMIGGKDRHFKYNMLKGELLGHDDNGPFFKHFLWLPYKKFSFTLDNEEYQLTTVLFPINKMSLKKGELMICHDLFPKLKRYSLISFTLSSMKRIALMLGLAIS